MKLTIFATLALMTFTALGAVTLVHFANQLGDVIGGLAQPLVETPAHNIWGLDNNGNRVLSQPATIEIDMGSN